MEHTGEYLYTLHAARPGTLTDGPTADEAAVLADHSLYLETLAEDRVVVIAGRTQTTDATSFGVVILRADSPAYARHIMESDPAVQGGVLTARLFPYKIAVQESGGHGGST